VTESCIQCVELYSAKMLSDFTFWITETKLRTKTKLNPKSEVMFLIWIQQIAKQKLSLRDSLSPKFGLSNSLSES